MAAWQHRHLNDTVNTFITDEYGGFQVSIVEDPTNADSSLIETKSSLELAKQHADYVVQTIHPHDCELSGCRGWDKLAATTSKLSVEGTKQ